MKIKKYNGRPVRGDTKLNDLPLNDGDVLETSYPLLDGRDTVIWDVVPVGALQSDGINILEHDDTNLIRRYTDV